MFNSRPHGGLAGEAADHLRAPAGPPRTFAPRDSCPDPLALTSGGGPAHCWMSARCRRMRTRLAGAESSSSRSTKLLRLTAAAVRRSRPHGQRVQGAVRRSTSELLVPRANDDVRLALAPERERASNKDSANLMRRGSSDLEPRAPRGRTSLSERPLPSSRPKPVPARSRAKCKSPKTTRNSSSTALPFSAHPLPTTLL